MTDPKSLSTLELVAALALADAYCRQTHAAFVGAEAERYKAAVLELAERFAQSWIATGEFTRTAPAVHPEQPVELNHDGNYPVAYSAGSPKHYISFDFPAPGPLLREP